MPATVEGVAMIDQDERKVRRPWMHLITDAVLGAAGPGRRELRGADVYAGQLGGTPGDNRTQDVYEQAARQRKR